MPGPSSATSTTTAGSPASQEHVEAQRDRDARAGGRVGAGVRQQVGEHLVQPGRIAGDLDRLVRQLQMHRVLGAGGMRIADRVDHERGEIDGRPVDGAAGVEPGEQQQVLDQAGHAAWPRTPPGPSRT